MQSYVYSRIRPNTQLMSFVLSFTTLNASCIHWLLHQYPALQWCLYTLVLILSVCGCGCTCMHGTATALLVQTFVLVVCSLYQTAANIPCTHGGCHWLHLALVACLIMHTFCRNWNFNAMKLQLYTEIIQKSLYTSLVISHH